MGICLPKENTFDPIQPPIFAFEISLETRGRICPHRFNIKGFCYFIVYFLRPLLSKECICKECTRRDAAVIMMHVNVLLLCVSRVNDVATHFFYKNHVFQQASQAVLEKYLPRPNHIFPCALFSPFHRLTAIHNIFHTC